MSRTGEEMWSPWIMKTTTLLTFSNWMDTNAPLNIDTPSPSCASSPGSAAVPWDNIDSLSVSVSVRPRLWRLFLYRGNTAPHVRGHLSKVLLCHYIIPNMCTRPNKHPLMYRLNHAWKQIFSRERLKSAKYNNNSAGAIFECFLNHNSLHCVL